MRACVHRWKIDPCFPAIARFKTSLTLYTTRSQTLTVIYNLPQKIISKYRDVPSIQRKETFLLFTRFLHATLWHLWFFFFLHIFLHFLLIISSCSQKGKYGEILISQHPTKAPCPCLLLTVLCAFVFVFKHCKI